VTYNNIQSASQAFSLYVRRNVIIKSQ